MTKFEKPGKEVGREETTQHQQNTSAEITSEITNKYSTPRPEGTNKKRKQILLNI